MSGFHPYFGSAYSRKISFHKKKEKNTKRVSVESHNILTLANNISQSDIKKDSDYQFAKVLLKNPHIHKKKGWKNQTALHILASRGYHQVLKNEHVDKVLDDDGRSPLFYLVASNMNNKDIIRMCRSFIKNNYPWYPLGTKEIRPELIDEIQSCNNAEKFIFGLSDE
jgi:hypothetical protein